MIRDVMRFNADVREAEVQARPDLTIAGLTEKMKLGAKFRDDYLYPFCGAIWSTPDHRIGAFPALTLLRFMRNHGLLSPGQHHQWWTVKGGSINYVEKLAATLKAKRRRHAAGFTGASGVSRRCTHHSAFCRC